MNFTDLALPPLPITKGSWHAAAHAGGRGATIKAEPALRRSPDVTVAMVYHKEDVPAFLALPELYRIAQAVAELDVEGDPTTVTDLRQRARDLIAHTEEARSKLLGGRQG